jgi:hypothetical protein
MSTHLFSCVCVDSGSGDASRRSRSFEWRPTSGQWFKSAVELKIPALFTDDSVGWRVCVLELGGLDCAK